MPPGIAPRLVAKRSLISTTAEHLLMHYSGSMPGIFVQGSRGLGGCGTPNNTHKGTGSARLPQVPLPQVGATRGDQDPSQPPPVTLFNA